VRGQAQRRRLAGVVVKVGWVPQLSNPIRNRVISRYNSVCKSERRVKVGHAPNVAQVRLCYRLDGETKAKQRRDVCQHLRHPVVVRGEEEHTTTRCNKLFEHGGERACLRRVDGWALWLVASDRRAGRLEQQDRGVPFAVGRRTVGRVCRVITDESV
jgi:hypothetical protein